MEIQERDRQIFELYKSGWRCVSIGERFGLTNRRVVQILAKLGYAPRPPAKIKEQDFRRLYAAGLTNSQLAAEFSVSQVTIHNYLLKFGLERNRKPKKINEDCRAENCQATGNRLGYCQKHYKRFVKYGSPLIVSKAGRPKR